MSTTHTKHSGNDFLMGDEPVPEFALTFLRTTVHFAHQLELTHGRAQIPESDGLRAEPLVMGKGKNAITIDKRDLGFARCTKCGGGMVLSFITWTEKGWRFTSQGDGYCEVCTFGADQAAGVAP